VQYRPLGLACLAEPDLPAGERVGSGVYLGRQGPFGKSLVGGWGSNPRPADYEKCGLVHHAR